MQRRILVVLIILGGLLLADAADATMPVPVLDGYTVGQTVQGNVSLANKIIPLPIPATDSVKWVVAAYGWQALPAPDPALPVGALPVSPGAILQLILLATDGKRVHGVAEIHTNLLPGSNGWGLSGDCRRADLYLSVLNYDSGWDGSCLFLGGALSLDKQQESKVWHDAQRFAQDQSLTMPRGWVLAGFRVTDRLNFVDLRLHFDPALEGLPPVDRWRASGNTWLDPAISGSLPHMAYIEQMSLWATTLSAKLEDGLRNRQYADLSVSWPLADANAVARSLQQDNLARLDALLAAGVIDKASHAQQSDLIRAEAAASEKKGWVSHSMQKNISFRVFGSIVDWILAFGVTLNSAVSTGITASIVGIHSIIFVANDNYWNDYWRERGRRLDSPLIDFRYGAVMP